MVTAKAFDCQKWLLSLDRITSAEPIIARFCKHEFLGVLYGTREEYVEIETAVREGVVKAGDPYLVYRIYLLGVAPRRLNSRPFNKNAFLWKHGRETDERAYRCSGMWYRICYYENAGGLGHAMFAESHPFGNSFILGEYRTHTFGFYRDCEIDYLDTPYKRSDLTVEFLK